MKESPLTLAARMAEKCRELFRRAWHPGWALFAEVTGESVASAQRLACDAATADEDAARILDLVLSDGIITRGDVEQLREVRRYVARSAALDHHLAVEVLA